MDWLDGNRTGLYGKAVQWYYGIILWDTLKARHGIYAGSSSGLRSYLAMSMKIETTPFWVVTWLERRLLDCI